MNNCVKALLIGVLVLGSPSIKASVEYESNSSCCYYASRIGYGSQDGVYATVANSMFTWGIVMCIGIAVVAGILHQSETAHAHAH